MRYLEHSRPKLAGSLILVAAMVAVSNHSLAACGDDVVADGQANGTAAAQTEGVGEQPDKSAGFFDTIERMQADIEDGNLEEGDFDDCLVVEHEDGSKSIVSCPIISLDRDIE